MIRIYRGDESDALAASREQQLALALLRSAPPQSFDGYRNDVETLLDRQYDKCAYCEIDVRGEATPVEHIRPKGEVTRVDWSGLQPAKVTSPESGDDDLRFANGDAPVDRSRVRWVQHPRGYWWLAWTWENHLLACTGCNTGLKTTRFPLRPGSPVMLEHDQPPGDEQALLVDPMRDDPMDHIRFEYDGTQHWKAFPRNQSVLGAWTILVLDLNGPRLLGKYARRVRDLERWSERLASLTSTPHDASTCRAEWEKLCDHALASDQPFLALTHDWLDARWDTGARATWGGSLSRPSLCLPGVTRTPGVRPAMPPRPEMAGLPERLQLEVRAQRHLTNLTDKRREVIRALLVCRPAASDAEIAAMVGCSPGDVDRGRREDKPSSNGLPTESVAGAANVPSADRGPTKRYLPRP